MQYSRAAFVEQYLLSAKDRGLGMESFSGILLMEHQGWHFRIYAKVIAQSYVSFCSPIPGGGFRRATSARALWATVWYLSTVRGVQYVPLPSGPNRRVFLGHDCFRASFERSAEFEGGRSLTERFLGYRLVAGYGIGLPTAIAVLRFTVLHVYQFGLYEVRYSTSSLRFRTIGRISFMSWIIVVAVDGNNAKSILTTRPRKIACNVHPVRNVG